MRILYSLFLISLGLCGCSAGPHAVRATMPLVIWRAEGESPRMRPAQVVAGSAEDGSPFLLTIEFNSDDTSLGRPLAVSWQVSLDGYCRDEPTIVRSVLISPSGRRWRAVPVFVPAGPDRGQDWSSGGFAEQYGGGQETADLLDAVSEGGLFTLAIEDEGGQVWIPSLVDTLTPAQRGRLFAANREAFEATPSDTVPVAGETPVVIVYAQPFRAPWPPRPCAETTRVGSPPASSRG